MEVLGGVLIVTRGLSSAERKSLNVLLKNGKIKRVRRGAYVLREQWTQLPDGRKMQALIAAEALQQTSQICIGRSAATLRGLALPSGYSPLHKIQLGSSVRSTSTSNRRLEHRKIAIGHQQRSLLMRTDFGDIRVSSLEDMCAELALWCPLDEAVVLIESAFARGAIPTFDWQDFLDEVRSLVRGRIGASRALRTLSLVTAFSESPRESELKLRRWEAGLPTPLQQATLRDRRGLVLGRADFLFECGLVVEYDGRIKYHLDDVSFNTALGHPKLSADQFQLHRRLSTSEVLMQERAREKAIQNEGFVVLRVDAAAYRSGKYIHQIRSLINTMNRFPIKPPMSQVSGGVPAWSEPFQLDAA